MRLETDGAHVPCFLEGLVRKEWGLGPPSLWPVGMDFLKLFASLETALPCLLEAPPPRAAWTTFRILGAHSCPRLTRPRHTPAPSPGQLPALSWVPCSWESRTPTGPADTDSMSLWSRHRVVVGGGPAQASDQEGVCWESCETGLREGRGFLSYCDKARGVCTISFTFIIAFGGGNRTF